VLGGSPEFLQPLYNPQNHGSMSQIKANDLTKEGYTYDQILKYFYGSDIKISCVQYSNTNTDWNTGDARWV
ncbi:MAG: hypothetical protein WBN94_11960, partial [Methanothrix sp.]